MNCVIIINIILINIIAHYAEYHPTVMISGTQPADSAASHLQSCDTQDDTAAAHCCFDHNVHLHSSIETPDCRVDEPSDDGVQDEGENLEKRI